MQKVSAFLIFDGVIFVSVKRKNYTKMHFSLSSHTTTEAIFKKTILIGSETVNTW